ncbi:MAG: exodeoxyribonuclease VII small subunit [Lachnospiraceae bacterium]
MMGKEEKTQKKDERTIQEIFAQLDKVIENMEQGDISLEESFRQYREGMELLKTCNDKIDKVEKKMLILDNEGEEHEFEN